MAFCILSNSEELGEKPVPMRYDIGKPSRAHIDKKPQRKICGFLHFKKLKELGEKSILIAALAEYQEVQQGPLTETGFQQ